MTVPPDAEARRGRTLDRLHAEGVALRPAGEILDFADLNFCYQLASLIARDEGTEPPAALDSAVLLERDRAFTWLVAGGGDWDSVVARK